MLEIENAMVLVLIFLNNNGLCGRLTDSNYFYTAINNVHEFSCMHNTICVHVMCMLITMHAICEGLFLDVTRVSMLTVSLLTKQDSGIFANTMFLLTFDLVSMTRLET